MVAKCSCWLLVQVLLCFLRFYAAAKGCEVIQPPGSGPGLYVSKSHWRLNVQCLIPPMDKINKYSSKIEKYLCPLTQIKTHKTLLGLWKCKLRPFAKALETFCVLPSIHIYEAMFYLWYPMTCFQIFFIISLEMRFPNKVQGYHLNFKFGGKQWTFSSLFFSLCVWDVNIL